MRLTRRGRALVLVVLVGSGMAWLFGARSLNAVVAPSLVALLASWYVMRNVDAPTIERRPPEPGFVGETRTIAFDLDAPHALPATLVDRLAEGVTPLQEGHVVDVTLATRSVAYEVTLDRRGVYELGPVSIEVTDPLGLVRRSLESVETTSGIVYPTVYELSMADLKLDLLPEGTKLHDRQEFDLLREYEHGDPLRDVHWKTTAKQPDDELIVRQFTADADAGDVIVAADGSHEHVDGSSEHADELASATASVALSLLSAGITVGVTVSDGAVPVDAGTDHRRRILDLLARTTCGHLDPESRETAAILLTVRDGAVEVAIGDRTIPFDRFLDEPAPAGGDRSSDTRIGDTSTGDTRTGSTRTGDTRTGDTRTGDTRTGGTRTGGTRTGGTRTGGTRTGGTRTGVARSDSRGGQCSVPDGGRSP